MFQLIFKGECVAGADIALARSSAHQLFKASDAQLDRMFSGKPVVIRNRLQQAEAEKYRILLHKHGMRAYVQAMAPAQSSKQRQSQLTSSALQPVAASRPPLRQQAQDSPVVGHAHSSGLSIAGERTDAVLAGSGLALDPAGVTLIESTPVKAPNFDHLDAWSLAPSGSDIGSIEDLPPPIVPDTSHLTVVPLPSDDDT